MGPNGYLSDICGSGKHRFTYVIVKKSACCECDDVKRQCDLVHFVTGGFLYDHTREFKTMGTKRPLGMNDCT